MVKKRNIFISQHANINVLLLISVGIIFMISAYLLSLLTVIAPFLCRTRDPIEAIDCS